MAQSSRFEKETKYFGFNPVSFTEEFVETSLDTSCDLVDALEQHLVERGEGSGDEEQILECTNKVMEVMEVALKKYLDKFELYVLRNILTVPENIEQLEKEEKEREGALAAVDGGDMIPMDVALNKELEELRKKVLAARYVNALLAAQSSKGKELKADQESLAQFAKILRLDMEFKTNELTPEMNEMMKKATDIHLLACGWKEEREKQEALEGDSDDKATMTNLSSDSLKGLGGTF